MSQKKKSGLQRGLSDIVAAQTAPVEDKSRLSRGLIDRFTEPKTTSGAVPTTPHHSPPLPTTPRSAPPPSAAPARDFNRRANSLERDAMPGGLFPGSSKKIYDALYLRSRGANPPRERARASRRDFLDWTDIRNLKTVDGHLRYLMSKGLIVRHWELGSTEGSEYEVRIPEELPPLTTTHHHSPPDTASHFSSSGNPQFSGSGGQGQAADSTVAYGGGKTFKTSTERSDDDEAFALLREAGRELTGREVDASQWREVAEVLATELKIAGARTTVSSAPAFLAEHLRRRLFKKDKRQLAAETAAAPASAPLPASMDVKTCPDCHGAGFWYPEGFEKGVARCAHEKLLKAEG